MDWAASGFSGFVGWLVAGILAIVSGSLLGKSVFVSLSVWLSCGARRISLEDMVFGDGVVSQRIEFTKVRQARKPSIEFLSSPR